MHRCRPGRQVGLDGPCRPVYAGAVERARRGFPGWAPPPKSESHETKASFKQGGFHAPRAVIRPPDGPIDDADIRRPPRRASLRRAETVTKTPGRGYFSRFAYQTFCFYLC